MKALEIRLSEDGGNLLLKALDEGRFKHYGFGTFLCDIKPNDIDITEDALNALLDCPEIGGLQGLELWADNRLAWGSPSPTFEVSLESVNKMGGADKWLNECIIEKGTDQ